MKNREKADLIKEANQQLSKIMKGIEFCRYDCSEDCPYYCNGRVVDCQLKIKEDMYNFIKELPKTFKTISENDCKLVSTGNTMNFRFYESVPMLDIYSLLDV